MAKIHLDGKDQNGFSPALCKVLKTSFYNTLIQVTKELDKVTCRRCLKLMKRIR